MSIGGDPITDLHCWETSLRTREKRISVESYSRTSGDVRRPGREDWMLCSPYYETRIVFCCRVGVLTGVQASTIFSSAAVACASDSELEFVQFLMRFDRLFHSL